MKRLNAEYDAFCNKTLSEKSNQLDNTISLHKEIERLVRTNHQLKEENTKLQAANSDLCTLIDQYEQDVIWRLPEFYGVSFIWIRDQNRIIARGDSYNCKEELKTYGFRWDPVDRVWYLEVPS